MRNLENPYVPYLDLERNFGKKATIEIEKLYKK